MKQSPTPTHPPEGQKRVDREAVKVLAIAVGVREAARQLGINPDTVRQWSSREKWFKKPDLPVTMQPVTTVTTPSQALQETLEQRKSSSRLSLSEYVVKASKQAQQLNGKALLKEARNVKEVASVHSTLWPEKGAEEGTEINILAIGGSVNLSRV